MRESAGNLGDASALAKLAEAEQRIERWTQDLNALAGAEALVIEAEQLAAGTSMTTQSCRSAGRLLSAAFARLP